MPQNEIPGFSKEEVQTKIGFTQQLSGGVIMDVTSPSQAKIAEDAGAVAVMALEKVPSDIRKEGGVARMAPIEIIEDIKSTVTIPVMAKCRIGHFIEAKILEQLEVDCIDESEVLTPADSSAHINKRDFKIPFVCGCRNLGEALRRIDEGASLIRTKGEAGTGNIVEAVNQMKRVKKELAQLIEGDSNFLEDFSKKNRVSKELVKWVNLNKKLPVPNFSAGGVATPADAVLMISLGAESVFVGSGIFKSENPFKTASAIVEAVAEPINYDLLLNVSRGLGEPMRGINIENLLEEEKFSRRGL